MTRALPAHLLLLLFACTDDTADRVPCGTGGPCAPGEICYDDTCRQVCIDDGDCPLELACDDGVCQHLGNECTADRQCTSPGPCQEIIGASCRGGVCRYPLLPENTACDDGNLCTHTTRCDTHGACVGSLVQCTDPPAPQCVAGDTARVFAELGTCSPLEGCSYAFFDLPCTGCPDCSNACLLDRDGNNTVDEVAAGAFLAGDGCQVCAPAIDAYDWSSYVCLQSVSVCRVAAGTCDPTRNSGNCQGTACCDYDPVWPVGSGDPRPSCPLAGEDADGDLVEDGGETWTGLCNHEGGCVTCESDDECSGGYCECADVECVTYRCSQVDCDCQFNGNGDDTCDGALADGFDDPDDSCGVLTCNGVGVCHEDEGEDCSSDAECESDHCADDVCCATPCAGTCDACNVEGSEGECVEASAQCGGACSTCEQQGDAYNCVAVESVCDAICTAAICVDEGSGVFNCDQSSCASCMTGVAPNNDGDCGSGINVELQSGCTYSLETVDVRSSSVDEYRSQYQCVDGAWVFVDDYADGGPCSGCTPEHYDTWSDNCDDSSAHREDC